MPTIENDEATPKESINLLGHGIFKAHPWKWKDQSKEAWLVRGMILWAISMGLIVALPLPENVVDIYDKSIAVVFLSLAWGWIATWVHKISTTRKDILTELNIGKLRRGITRLSFGIGIMAWSAIAINSSFLEGSENFDRYMALTMLGCGVAAFGTPFTAKRPTKSAIPS